MIELIFAIVIIGIAVAGVPRMIERNSKSLEGNLIQEGIFATSAKAAQLLTYRWDANSQDPNDLLSHSKILDIPGGSTDLNRTNSIFRVGGVAEDSHRRFHSAVTNPNGIILDGLTTGVVNFITGSAGEQGYKHKFRVNIDISFVNDGDGSYNTASNSVTYNFPDFPSVVSNTPTNMKMAKIALQMQDENGNWNKMAVLDVYAANIGEIDYYKRTMP